MPETKYLLNEEDVLKKADFTKSFKQIIDLVIKMQQKQGDAIRNLQETYAGLLAELKGQYSGSLSSLEGKMSKIIESHKGDLGNLAKEKVATMDGRLKMIRDGKDGQKGAKGDRGEKGEPGSPDKPEDVRNKLEKLKGDERLDKKAIRGLDDVLSQMQSQTNVISRGGPAVNSVQFADLTAQCNGVLTSFEVPRHRFALMLVGTQFPIIYRNITDFTTSNKTLTLTSEVSAPATGQSLIFLYVK